MAILQALTTGQLLDRIFSLYRRNFLMFFAIAVMPQLAYLLMMSTPYMGIWATPTTRYFFLIPFFVGFLVYMAALAVSQGATTVAVSDLYLDRPASAIGSYKRMLPMTLRLIGLVIGYGLLVGLGMVLLIVPGVYFALTYSLAITVMAIEKVSFSEAMTRSKDLVEGNRGRVAIIYLLSFVITYAVAIALGIPLEFVALRLVKTMPVAASLLNLVTTVLANALAAPIGLIGFTLAYYDARVRKEAFDLHYMMETEAATSGNPAAVQG